MHLIRIVLKFTMAEMKMGTVTGKMNNGTVNWLNNARPAKTFSGLILFSSMMKYNPNVTNVISADEAWVKNAESSKE